MRHLAAFLDIEVPEDRWRDVLTPAQLDRYDAVVADGLPADAAQWLESGSLTTGSRPHALQ
ncbi:MAG TPA: hypothetical protein VES40_14905 [Ilumatobacteraceae bacterium]|nr:hypothetical protein [Ilumatobacteraceae bacterium]